MKTMKFGTITSIFLTTTALFLFGVFFSPDKQGIWFLEYEINTANAEIKTVTITTYCYEKTLIGGRTGPTTQKVEECVDDIKDCPSKDACTEKTSTKKVEVTTTKQYCYETGGLNSQTRCVDNITDVPAGKSYTEKDITTETEIPSTIKYCYDRFEASKVEKVPFCGDVCPAGISCVKKDCAIESCITGAESPPGPGGGTESPPGPGGGTESPPGPGGGTESPSGSSGGNRITNPLKDDFSTLPKFISAVLNVLVKIGIPIAAMYIIYAGYLFVTAQGNEEQLKEAKKAFVWAVIGTAILLGATIMIDALVETFNNFKAP